MNRHQRKERARWFREMRKRHVRAAGDHRRWNPSIHQCCVCKARYVRLFRSYGTFLRVEDLRCNVHVPADSRGWWVPLIEAQDGSVWGYTSCPQADIDRWFSRPDADLSAPRWSHGDWHDQPSGGAS